MTDPNVEALMQETARTVQYFESVFMNPNADKVFSSEERTILKNSQTILRTLLNRLIIFNETGKVPSIPEGISHKN